MGGILDAVMRRPGMQGGGGRVGVLGVFRIVLVPAVEEKAGATRVMYVVGQSHAYACVNCNT